ncbi:T9SS type A sorting domain-containing protein [Neolewinella agarilytica]|uniref:T9SS type A sorting domain-containing protein n=1 Tax=Neolewinella agarilytica TaxID=478744 RepID=UPI0023522CCE|nr:T9SS type A sorting domain-containing protein [Neolewinella agarilytica]
MLYKIILCLSLLATASSTLSGQSLDWVFLEPGEGCGPDTDCSVGQQCYGLSYTPSLTGTATSYTFGFLANCVNGGSASLLGSSCTMTDNTDLDDSFCGGFNVLQFQPSGNTGSLAVTAGVPVILHQVCLTLGVGESMSFDEDVALSLTVSINLPGGGSDTDEPAYTTFTSTSADCDVALPVSWESFTARQVDKTARLDWAVSDETDHDYYSVEWSADGLNFSPLATVRAAIGQQGVTSSYSFDHLAPAPGTNYYRLRQVDFGGTYSYSTVEMLTFTPSVTEQGFSLFPNPASEEAQLSLSDGHSAQTFSLMTVTGKLIRTVNIRAGQARITLSLEGLPKGVYLVRVGEEVKQLVKQ